LKTNNNPFSAPISFGEGLGVRMKIAFLTPEYPHPKTGFSGGIGTSIRNLAVGLLAEGCSVRVLVYGQKTDAVFDDNGICVQQIKNIKFKGLSWYFTRKKIVRIINQLHSNAAIDLVEAPDWTGITSFIKPKKCPILIKLHGSDTYFCHLDNRLVKAINKFHEKRALKNADGLLSVSQFTADLTNAIFGLKKEFTIIPNCIDVNKFKSIEQPTTINQQPRILYFGTLIRKKGLLELPLIFNEVIKSNPEAKFVLVGKDASDSISGNTSTWAMMQSLFETDAFQNVSYLGSVSYAEIKMQIAQATVCVFPSFAEALPVSWIEAMAMQKPVVASNIGWATEIIDDGVNGFLVNPKQHKEYAQRILDLLENPALQKEFGIKGRTKIIEKFSIKVVAQESLAFYKSLID
jgi:glycosyltransferase involved in cell wall biosynthesis